MQMFGLLSLLITVALAAWWLTSGLGGVTPPSDSKAATSSREGVGAEYMMDDPFTHTPRPNYGEAIDSAKGAADTLEQ